MMNGESYAQVTGVLYMRKIQSKCMEIVHKGERIHSVNESFLTRKCLFQKSSKYSTTAEFLKMSNLLRIVSYLLYNMSRLRTLIHTYCL